MRYVVNEIIVNKVSDIQVEDKDQIVSLIKIICDKALDCSLKLTDGIKMQKCRITNVSEDEFSFMLITKSSSLQKTVLLNTIEFIEITTNDAELIRTKPNVSRWELIDSVEK